MKRIIFNILFFAILSQTLVSCRLIGVNINRKTPSRGYVYPNFNQKDSVKGALNQLRSNFDVKHYNIAISINPDKKYISGYVDIDFVPEQALTKLQIDLFKNMQLDSIVWQSKELQFYRKYNAVYVSFPQEVKSRQTIRCYYKGKPTKAPKPPWKGGFVWEKAEDKSPWIGVACELTGASLWFPLKDHISDEPEEGMILDVTVPKGLRVVSNGVLTKEENINDKSRFVWETNYPINNYNITLYVGKFQNFSEEYKGLQDTFLLDYYVLPEHLEKAKKTFPQTKEILSFYESIYGAYPWSDEGFKLVASPYEGMEHQTAIAYGSGFEPHYLGFDVDYIILHETAHEWFGNSISVPDYADIFLHEGFATYSEALYIEHKFGKEKGNKYMLYYGMLIQNKNPIIGPQDVNFWDYRDTDPYLKGAWTLHGLRNIMANDSLFFNLLSSFYKTYEKSVITTTDFIDFVNKKTATDYNWYFNQYLYKREVPCLEFKSEEKGNALHLQARWTDVGGDFRMPVRVEVNDLPMLIYPTLETQTFVIEDWESLEFDINYAYYRLKEVKKLK